MTDIKEIEGIGSAFGAKLEAIGIGSVEELLEKGAHTRDRERIAEQSSLTYDQILEWVNRADLARIKGIGSEYADLLEFAGVDTVPELAQRRADNLTAKLAEVNAEKSLVRRLPTETEVADWIAQAKALPRRVWYEARTTRPEPTARARTEAEKEPEVVTPPPTEPTRQPEEGRIPVVPVVAAAAAVAAAPVVEEPVVPRAAPLPTPAVAPPEAGANRWLWGLLGLLGIGLLVWFLMPKGSAPPAATTTPAAVPVAGAAAQDITMLYDGGAEKWIVAAADEFNKQRGGDAKIALTKMGSREGRDHILYDKDQIHPVVWSPADDYWIDKIQMDSANPSLPGKSGATAGDAKPLLHTYLVLLMPDDRAKVFTSAMAKPENQGKTWGLMRALATKGWGAVGGPADWGKLKLAQTDPTRSNSGMTALTLMFQEWAAAHPGKDINDKGFLATMGEVEGSVGAFAPATSELIKSFATGHGKEDIAIVYESDAIRAIQGGARGLRIVYPSPTVAVTIPAAVVQGAWVTAAQGKLGQEFIDYLTTDDVQAKAPSVGYRPVSTALVGKTTEAFAALKAAGVEAAPTAAATEADTKTKEGLIFNWNEWHKKRGG